MKTKIKVLLTLMFTAALVQSCDRGRQPIFDDSIEGKTAPAFSLPQLGKATSLTLADYKGKLVMVNSWASWCLPCRDEMPTFIKIQKQFGGDQFTILGISIENKEDVKAYADQLKINYPVTYGADAASKVAAAYGDPDGALPYSVLISPEQKVLEIYPGVIKQEQFKSLIAKHL